MSDELDASQPTDHRGRRRLVIIAAAGVAVAVAAVVLALFQPWKLWIDDEVDEAAPAGAVPVTAPVASTPTTVPPASPEVSAPPTASSAPAASTAPPATTAPVTDVPASAPTTTVAPPTVPSTVPEAVGGEFISIDHGTTGTAVLLQDAAGTQYVRLQDLDTSNGPDLFVYLSANPHDGPEGQFDDDFVNLGRLQGNVGSSNYAVPVGTDVFRYASVVIWCDRFNSAFGAAPLG